MQGYFSASLSYHSEQWPVPIIILLFKSPDLLNKRLNYEEKESELVTSLLFKDKTVLHYIKEHTKDLDGNFPYWYTILSSLALRDMLGEPFEQEYKEKNYQRKNSGISALDIWAR